MGAYRLAERNAQVDLYNERRMIELRRQDTTRIFFKAIDKISGATSKTEVNQVLFNLKDKSARETQGLPTTLILQVGVRYMITCNIDVPDGLFNGAIGVLRFIEFKAGKAEAIYLEFDDPNVGKDARGARQSIMRSTPAINEAWTPITRIKLAFRVTRKVKAQVIREQYPLTVSEAITIYKSQGSTMQRVVVEQKYTSRQSLYVACSRATKIEGLFLLGEFKAPEKPTATHAPANEMKRLREESMLVTKFGHLSVVPENTLQIISANVQSIRKHIGSIKSDFVFAASDVLLFQEIWAMSNETFDIDGMMEIQRNAIENRPTARGTNIYAKEGHNILPEKVVSFESNNQRIDITSCMLNNISLINIYKSPRTTFRYFKLCMEMVADLFRHQNVVLCGDFNEQLDQQSNIVRFLSDKFTLRMLSSPNKYTTDAKTTIDGVFGKLAQYDFNVSMYESYYSFHKPLVIRLQPKNSE
ncbi:hypothetical protein PVAND_013556 [Polypedilum vanderplanki]|uniref:Endonuclease/exonuclease/phosphatase domain-containing protein n=1 Tax=Polypedilum vanderplanki TaxID=319348 RepID=A0A9J6CQ21_POLVA|nr:hypothetical protein PVAND_013556 [Polypedilum vanderplanki]